MNKIWFFIKQVFDKAWHKLHLGIFKDKLVLYIDCEYIGTANVHSRAPIKIDGNISIAKRNNSKITVPVKLLNFNRILLNI